MAFHPPFLYLGFTAFAVPFAYALAALLSGEFGQAWLRHSRTWTVAAWSFLTVGIVLGAFWAYIELGWGGFWAWDPVENASFLPWLMGTAFLHTSVLQQRRRILEFWNIILCLGTYLLTVLGTFLTRSGIVQSVHAFASSDSSAVFLSYMVFVLLLSVGLIALRWSKLRSGRRIENLLSKETLLLLNSLILVSVCFAVLWGVFFPVLSEALLGKKQAVAAPFFNAVNVPFFLLLLFVLALGMLVPWGGISLKALGARMLMPLSLGLLCSISLLGLGVENFYALLCYGLCACAGSAVGLEIFGRTTLQKGGKVNFGAQLVHLGLLIVAVSVCASTVHKSEVDFSLNQGQEFSYEGFSFKLEDLKPYAAKNYEAHTAQVEVRQGQDGSPYTLVPELRVYPRSKETTSEIALRVALWEDLYLVLADINYQEKQAVFRLFINPLQVWLWIGAAIMAFGGIIVLISRLRSRNTEGANE
jgi:cytochrome c-type biogenesis protein CcmF